MSFEEAYNEYLIYARKQHKKESFNTCLSIFKSRILPFFKDKILFDLTKKDVLNWTLEISNLNFSNNYNRNCYYTLFNFFEYCVEYLNFPKNYLKEIGKFKKKPGKKKSDFYTLKEFKKFIKYVDNEVYKQFFTFMFFTGTRPGETFALQFKDIENGYVSINKTLTSHNGREFDFPKSDSSMRMIKLDKKLKKDILNLKKLYVGCNSDYFVFGGRKPLAPTTVNRYKLKACQRANLRPITLHQFRHSHATLLVNNNILINEVSKRLGHSDVSITLNTYVHTDLMQEKRVYNTLNILRFNFFNTCLSTFKNFISLLKHFAMF